MLKFILKKLFSGFFIILGVAVVVFVIFKVMPGDPVESMLGQQSDPSTKKKLAADMYLDQPLSTQFLFYMRDLSPVSIHEQTEENQEKYKYLQLISFGKDLLVLKTPYLGRSIVSQRYVSDIIVERFPSTAWLALASITFATILGIIIGVIAALKQGRIIDRVLVTTSILGISIPSFVSAVIIGLIFAVILRDYTGLNLFGSLYETHAYTGVSFQPKNLILPAITLGIRPLAVIVQLTRSSMIDAMKQDYIRTAKSKGLSMYSILFKHALRNALNPVITAISGWFAGLLAGAFFIEKVFNWKGLGLETINAVFSLDFPVVIGSTLFIGGIFILVSIIVDIIYAWLDPRVRLH